MKESKLVEMQNRQQVLLQSVSRLAQEFDMMKTLVFGHDQIIKKLDQYDAIIAELRQELEDKANKLKEDESKGEQSGEPISGADSSTDTSS